jgi:hypothetical protein
MSDGRGAATRGWLWAGGVFLVVLLSDWLVVGAAGTDVPFQDQWDAHGRRLLAAAADGSFHLADLGAAHSEHRIVWTNALALLLFRVNGQWDPLVELLAVGLLRAAAATLVFALASGRMSPRERALAAGAVILGFAPLAAWHNVLWGFQTSVPFVLGFGLPGLHALSDPVIRPRRLAWGVVMVLAAGLAMGPGLLLAAALAPVLVLQRAETGRWSLPRVGTVAGLAALALVLVPAAGGTGPLTPATAGEFWRALGRSLGWPHTGQPWAAILVNLPLAVAVGGRALGRRRGAEGEDFVTAVAAWIALIGVASAWRRGGGAEWLFGAPSRYADLLVLLPLANLWVAAVLVKEVRPTRSATARALAGAWSLFLLMGWVGLSCEMLTRVVLPRARDREAPVRLIQAYQRSGDAAAFAGQPRLLVPHPDLSVVRAVLDDGRMQGRLPPSLQPGQPMGPLSRAARFVLRRSSPSGAGLIPARAAR